MMLKVVLAILIGMVGTSALANTHHEGHGEGGKEPAPETFVILDLFSEALESSVAGLGVKVTELKSKAEHIRELYRNGEKHKAFAKTLGTSTEVVLLGFMIEAFGIGEMFISALSFSGNWLMQLAQSLGGVAISTKVALLAGEHVEEATIEKYKHAVRAEAEAHEAAMWRRSWYRFLPSWLRPSDTE